MARMRQQLRAMNCASDQGSSDQIPKKHHKVKFGVPLSQAFKKDVLPQPLVDSLVYIAKDGVTTTDLFRRPGNPKGVKQMMKSMAEGRQFTLDDFNFYTHASVIKKFLLRIPNGVFGIAGETSLLSALDLTSPNEQQDLVSKVILSLLKPTQRLLALLFGTWFRMIHHAEYSQMSSEALAKSVTGSVFHTCSDSPAKVGQAVKIMKILIENFACASVFGRDNIQYYVDTTRSSIKIKEKFKYQYKYPADDLVDREKAQELFELILKREARQRGFSVQQDAVSPEQYYGHEVSAVPVVHTSYTNGVHEESMVLEQDNHKSDHGPNKLMNATSASAPDVNADTKHQEYLAGTKRMYATKSLSRFEYVKKKQIDRMHKRSDWFLSLSQGSIYDNTSEYGDRSSRGASESREASEGRTMSETATSDAGFSDGESFYDNDERRASGYDTPASIQTRGSSSRPPRLLVNIVSDDEHANSMHDNGVNDSANISASQDSDLDGDVVEKYFVTERWYKPIQ